MTSPSWTPIALRNTLPVRWMFHQETASIGYVNTQFGTWVAVKVFNTRCLREWAVEKALLRKIKDRFQGVPPYFVEVIPDFAFGTNPNIVMELCAGGDLLDYRRHYLRDFQPLQFPEEIIWRVYNSLVNALLFLKYGRTGRPANAHTPDWKQILHRDIKADNVLVRLTGAASDQQQFVLCDFGLAAEIGGIGWSDVNPDKRTGTPYWLPPEMCVKDNLPMPDEKLDVWGVGAVVQYLALGRFMVAHELEVEWPDAPTPQDKLRIPRAPTFIDAISTGTLEEALTFPGRPIYSRKLNCKMMEALAFDPKKRASVDRLAENWPADGEVLEPFSVCHPEFGPGQLAVRPSPLKSRSTAETENRLRWGLESISGPAWAAEYEGVPYDLDRRRRQRDALQFQKDNGTRRQSFGDWTDLKRPSGIEDRRNYPELGQRLVKLDRSVKDKKALRQDEEDRIDALKKDFNRRLWTRPGLVTKVKMLCRHVARETGIRTRVVRNQMNEKRTLPGMTFEQMLAELDKFTPRARPEYDAEESSEDEQPPRKRTRSEIQPSSDHEDDFIMDFGSSEDSAVSPGRGVAQSPAPPPKDEKRQGINDDFPIGLGSSGAGSPKTDAAQFPVPPPENQEQQGAEQEGHVSPTRHSDRSPTLSAYNAGNEAEATAREESAHPSSPKSQEEQSVKREESLLTCVTCDARIPRREARQHVADCHPQRLLASYYEPPESRVRSAAPERERPQQSGSEGGFVTAPETAQSQLPEGQQQQTVRREFTIFQCDVCSFMSLRQGLLERHYSESHPDLPHSRAQSTSQEHEPPQQSGGEEGFVTAEETAAQSPLPAGQQHQGAESEEVEDVKRCSFCDFRARDPREYRDHMLRSHVSSLAMPGWSVAADRVQTSSPEGSTTQTGSREEVSPGGSTTQAKVREEVSPGGSATEAEDREEVSPGGSVQQTVPEIQQLPRSEEEGIPQGESGETAPVEGQTSTSTGDEEKKEDPEDAAPRKDSGPAPGLQGLTSGQPRPQLSSREW